MKKTITIAALLAVALILVTCAPEELIDNGADGGIEYTDVVYEFTGGVGNERVKTVTLYLDGEMVPKPAQQRAVEKRALSLEGARMSHNFFEAVFMNGTGTARASWEIGQPAGISGLVRGISYGGLTPGTGSSTVFVGRKSGKTLLGVGYMTHVDDIVGTTIGTNSRSVTFTVSALRTWASFDSANTVSTTIKSTDPEIPMGTGNATFVTATGDGTSYADADADNTTGETYVYPRFTGVSFPLYYLPTVSASTPVAATYTVGGLSLADITIFAPEVLPSADINTLVRTWGRRASATPFATYNPDTATNTTNLRGGLQFIKRTPAFMYKGLTYEITGTYYDKITTVTEVSPPAGDAAFEPAMGIRFNMTAKSGGLFSITFQVPVYALSIVKAYNGALLVPEKWYIRSDYEQYQYLLDNGIDSGGALLIGDIAGVTADDWIEIYTTGIAFDN